MVQRTAVVAFITLLAVACSSGSSEEVTEQPPTTQAVAPRAVGITMTAAANECSPLYSRKCDSDTTGCICRPSPDGNYWACGATYGFTCRFGELCQSGSCVQVLDPDPAAHLDAP